MRPLAAAPRPSDAKITVLLPSPTTLLAVPPKCSSCAFFSVGDKGCARVVISLSQTEATFELARVVRSHKSEAVCGPRGKGFMAKTGLAPA